VFLADESRPTTVQIIICEKIFLAFDIPSTTQTHQHNKGMTIIRSTHKNAIIAEKDGTKVAKIPAKTEDLYACLINGALGNANAKMVIG
jgi:hypothetical protein